MDCGTENVTVEDLQIALRYVYTRWVLITFKLPILIQGYQVLLQSSTVILKLR